MKYLILPPLRVLWTALAALAAFSVYLAVFTWTLQAPKAREQGLLLLRDRYDIFGGLFIIAVIWALISLARTILMVVEWLS